MEPLMRNPGSHMKGTKSDEESHLQSPWANKAQGTETETWAGQQNQGKRKSLWGAAKPSISLESLGKQQAWKE